jgi:hypothetical protein
VSSRKLEWYVLRGGKQLVGQLVCAIICTLALVRIVTYPLFHSYINQNDEGLTEFYKDYFQAPLYRDETLGFYKALGDGSIMDNVSYNPFKIFKGIRAMGKRMKDKKIEGNLVGEGLKTGGIIIFGTDGQPKYMYPEDTGTPIDVEEFLSAVQSVRNLLEVTTPNEL